MIEYIVRTGPDFEREMEKILAYLNTGLYSKRGVNRLLNDIYKDLSRFKTSPKIGPALSSKTSIPNDYRYLLSGEYFIFYKVFEKLNLVQLYHIYHGKENYLVKLGLIE